MAEALAVLGAVSSVLQIIDFTSKLVSHARELSSANNDALRDNIEVERLARQQEAKELLSKLQELRRGAAANRWQRVREGSKAAVRNLRAREDIDRRHGLLRELNGLLATALLQAGPNQVTTILDHLRFPDMQLRGTIISEAYPSTYQWALRDDSLKLKPWLQRDDGIFWIKGKPGAGKSTLMKYITTAAETPVLLQQWARDSELVIASFYFWYLGSAMQKSIEGLLRSILYQLLRALPVLASEVCPEYFKTSRLPDGTIWTAERLLQALKDAITMASKICNGLPARMFCFFIDGLDEYTGNPLELVELLISLTRETGVKICLSSRPYTPFQKAFKSRFPYLQLEDITMPDIHTYVHGHIRKAFNNSQNLLDATGESSMNLDEVDALVHDIVKKAEGVFLWVFLVVAYVERGLAEYDSLAMLRRRIEQFPEDLDQFFRKLIFDRVDQVYVKQTCQALQLAFLYSKTQDQEHGDQARGISTWLDFWIISQSEEGLNKVNTAKAIAYKCHNPDSKQMVLRTKTFLSATCKDLLVLEQNADDHQPRVHFLHRTVYSFLCTSKMTPVLIDNTPSHFHSTRILHLMNGAKAIIAGRSNAYSFSELPAMARASLAEPHDDLDYDYVANLELALLKHAQGSCFPDHLSIDNGVIATLIAARKYTLLDRWFGPLLCKHLIFDHNWVAAALGFHKALPFALQYIDTLFLEQLQSRNALAWRRACDHHLQGPHLRLPLCCGNVSEAFLSQWAIEARRNEQRYRDEVLPVAWKVAKIFMRSVTRWLGCVFCAQSSVVNEPHVHKYVTAREWLLQEIPASWIMAMDERDLSRSLVRQLIPRPDLDQSVAHPAIKTNPDHAQLKQTGHNAMHPIELDDD